MIQSMLFGRRSGSNSSKKHFRTTASTMRPFYTHNEIDEEAVEEGRNSTGSADDFIDPESSILVAKQPKAPNKYHQNKSVTITTGADFHKAQYGQEDGSASSGQPRHKPFSILEAMANSANSAEIEALLESLRHSELLEASLELYDHARHLERHAELREELLRRGQGLIETKEKAIREKDRTIQKLEQDIMKFEEKQAQTGLHGMTDVSAIKCRYNDQGCNFRLPSMENHEENFCKFRPTRCPSLTCPVKPPFAKLMDHIKNDHDGNTKGRDKICRNNTNQLVSSYINIDQQPVFYKNTKMTWVANELVFDGHHFFLECMRCPPDWHIWVYIIGSDAEAGHYQTTIQLFPEAEYGKAIDEGYSNMRTFTGPVIPIQISKEDVAEYSMGFQLHDKQIRSLCGPITNQEEQLFGYEVSVYRK